MSDRDKILEEKKPREYLGLWWIPEKESTPHNVAGLLRIENGTDPTLQVLGELMPGDRVDSYRKYSVVNGVCHGQREFTMFDVTISRQELNGFESPDLTETHLWCLDAWCGKECFASKQDIAFVSFSAGMYGLAALHDVRSFHSDFKFEEHTVELLYKRPDDVELYEDDKIRAFLGYSWRGPSSSLGQVSADIAHDAQIVIKSKQGVLPFYGEVDSYDFYLTQIRTILGLFSGMAAHLYECKGTVRECVLPKEGVAYVPELILTRTWRREERKVGEKDVSPLDVMLPLKNIDSMNDVVKGFISLPSLVRGFAGHLVYLNGTSENSLTQGMLSEYVFMFEGSHRELFEAAKKKPILIARILDEMARLAKVYPWLMTDELGLSLAIYIKKRRDNYSHANPDSYHEEFRLFMFATFWMRHFLSAMYLEASGVPTEKIAEGFGRNFRFVDVYNELPRLIRQHRTVHPDELADFKNGVAGQKYWPVGTGVNDVTVRTYYGFHRKA